MPPVAWTRPDDVRAALRRKWQSGALLTAFADGADWEPLGFPLRGPSPGEIGGALRRSPGLGGGVGTGPAE